jgi:glycosyltransferase involved in cell wall biosynthesis
MKIAYVTTYDTANINAWSGLGFYIRKALNDVGLQTTAIDHLVAVPRAAELSRWKQRFYRKLLAQKYLADREPEIAKNYAVQVEQKLASVAADVIFSPGTLPIAYLETTKPIVFWADATFAGMLNFYPVFTGLCNESVRHGHRIEQAALSRCSLAIYASEWAASTALQHYDVDPAKVKVVPFGANIQCNRSLLDIETILERKQFDVCKLLFLGIDWLRKGGDIALAVANRLNERGLKTELHIAGCEPPQEVPTFVKTHGYISKQTQQGRDYLDQLLTESHFLILPSLAECFGVVFAEANSFGLPALATNVGGIPTAVRSGKNGWTFNLNSSPDDYCDVIAATFSSPERYRVLALSSFKEYSQTLNWASAGQQVHNLIQSVCPR